MTEYDDLTEYSYLAKDERERESMRNVGWLGIGAEFTTGPVADDVVDALIVLADDMRHATRGFHQCPFCDVLSPIRMTIPGTERTVPLGMSEIHVEGEDGIVYAAPTLVIHYILDHDYCPPEEFRRAAVNAVEPS